MKYVPSLCLVLLMMLSCECGLERTNRTTHTSSKTFKTYAEKMEFLSRYLVNQAGLLDAEYEIDYQDNSGNGRTIPGPSDWDMRMVLRVVPDSLNAWTGEGKRQEFAISHELWKGLASDSLWKAISTPVLFTEPGMVKLIHRPEGIVLAYYTTTPVELEKYKLNLPE